MSASNGKLNPSAIIAASLAGLLFGFDTAVIAGVTEALRGTFGLSPAQLGAAVSAALVGTLIGALGAGKPGDRYGSRTILLWIAAAYIVSALGSALSSGLAMVSVAVMAARLAFESRPSCGSRRPTMKISA